MSVLSKKGRYIEILLRQAQSVFTTQDISLLWGEPVGNAVRVRLTYYVKTGQLLRVRQGIYVKDANYNLFELATRICTPSYISFETVLTQSGVNFQHYDTVFVASYLNRTIEVGGHKIAFVRLKNDILTDASGVDHEHGYARASAERAFLDRLYVSKEYHFDNLHALNWEKVFGILPIYQSKRMEKTVGILYEHHKNS